MSGFKSIGKFDVVSKIGEGSFGVVYRGYDPFLKRDVAIKVCSVADDGLRQRFAREGQISGNLHHRNIVTVFAYGHEGDIPYLVQEFLSGEDLDQLIKKRVPLLPSEKIDYLQQIAQGLGYAHQQGIVHRDIKPANIRRLDDGQIKIMDFGIAKLASAETQLTQKGVTLGTASYLPPEQVRGGEVDHRADIFSFGVLAYELMTYERPFRGNTLSALVYQILYKSPLPVSTIWKDCPEPLSQLISECLEKKAERRPAGFEVLLPRFEELQKAIADGQWPVLLEVPDLAAATNGGKGESEVLSQSVIQRAAQDADEALGDVGSDGFASDTISVEGLAPSPRTGRTEVEPETESTRPVAVTGDTGSLPPPPPPADMAATVVMEGSAVDDLAKPESAAVDIAPEPLSTRAEEIGRLVATGQLELAKEQLAETLEWARESDEGSSDGVTQISPQESTPAEPTVAPEPPAASKSPPAKASAASEPLAAEPPPPLPPAVSTSAAEESSAPESEKESPSVPPAASAPPPAPAAAAAAARSAEVSRPATTRTAAAQQPRTPARSELSGSTIWSGSYGTLKTLWPIWGRWILAGLGALIVLVVGWNLLAPSPPPPEPSPPPAPVVRTPPPPTEIVDRPAGGLIVEAHPWAQIASIVDASGEAVSLPELPFTPIYLRLPPGRYVISIIHPEFADEIRQCEVEISVDEVASCEETFFEATALDYFKEVGWWE